MSKARTINLISLLPWNIFFFFKRISFEFEGQVSLPMWIALTFEWTLRCHSFLFSTSKTFSHFCQDIHQNQVLQLHIQLRWICLYWLSDQEVSVYPFTVQYCNLWTHSSQGCAICGFGPTRRWWLRFEMSNVKPTLSSYVCWCNCVDKCHRTD